MTLRLEYLYLLYRSPANSSFLSPSTSFLKVGATRQCGRVAYYSYLKGTLILKVLKGFSTSGLKRYSRLLEEG